MNDLGNGLVQRETARMADRAQVMLELLNAVERNNAQTQRRLASELGIALGLANAYLRRCIKKGWVKARQVPAGRHIYYLTPRGFAEKSKLTVQYLYYSFEFFRQAKTDYIELFEEARKRGQVRLAFSGKSDLTEIAAICIPEAGVDIVAIVDDSASGTRFLGFPLVRSFDEMSQEPDAIVVTDSRQPHETCKALIARFGRNRVLVPKLLNLGPNHGQETSG
jgi:predicted transcriptional regulator